MEEKELSNKKKQRAKMIEVYVLLKKKYPKVFVSRGEKTLPLKIGVMADLLAENPDLDAHMVRAAVARYSHKPRYQNALRKGGNRFDLAGNVCGVVSEEHAAIAKQKLELMNKKRAA